LYHSKLSTEAKTAGDWVIDTPFSGAAVPIQILHAEELLLAATENVPEAKKREKTAERALRIYYHAKWLAERNFEKAAVWRYREAARLAKSCRRSVLAAHALSRLGYFLMFWNERDEARQVLAESEKLNKKQNPLAPFLLGVLEREVAGDDEGRLRAAEDRILAAADLPSEELNADHRRLIDEIKFWRSAEHTSRNCLKTDNVAHVIICFFGHMFFSLRQAVVRYL